MNKKIIIISFIIILAFITGIILLNKMTKKKEIPESNIRVSVLKPEYKTISPTIESFGTVQYKTKTDITCLQDGQVINKMVSEGELVKKGQILYVLKNTELEIQHSQYINELNSSKANIDLYLAKLEEHKRIVQSALLNINPKGSRTTQGTTGIKLNEGYKCIASIIGVTKDYNFKLITEKGREKEFMLDDIVSSENERRLFDYIYGRNGNQGNFLINTRTNNDIISKFEIL